MDKEEQQAEQQRQQQRRDTVDRMLDGAWSSFSFGDLFSLMFWGALLTVGLYLAVKHIPAVHDLARDLLPSSARIWIEDKLSAFGLSLFPDALQKTSAAEAYKLMVEHADVAPEIASVLTGRSADGKNFNNDTWQGFLKIAKDANPNSKTLSSTMLTNSNTIAALLTKRPDLAHDIVSQIKPAEGKGNKALTAALGELLNNKEKLEAILKDNQARPVAVLAMQRLSTALPFKQDADSTLAIEQFLLKVGMKDGTLTPEFQALLGNVMKPDAKKADLTAQATAYIKAAMVSDPTTTLAFVSSIAPEGLPEELKGLTSKETTKAMATLLTAIPEANRGEVMGALSSDNADPKMLMDMLLKDEVLKEPKALGELATAMLPKLPAATDQEQKTKAFVTLLAHNPAPTATLLRGLGKEKIESFIATATDEVAGLMFVFHRDNLPHFMAFANTVNRDSLPTEPNMRWMVDMLATTPEPLRDAYSAAATNGLDINKIATLFVDTQGTISVDHVVRNLLDPKRRQTLTTELGKITPEQQDLIIDHLVSMERIPPVSTRNLRAVLQFVNHVQGVSVNQGANAERTQHVLQILTGTVMKDPSALAQLANPGKEMAAFFGQDINRRIVSDLLNELDLCALPPSTRPLLNALKEHWMTGGTDGLAYLMTKEAVSEQIFAQIAGFVNNTPAPELGFFDKLDLGMQIDNQYDDDIAALRKALKDAEAINANGANPLPAALAAAAACSR